MQDRDLWQGRITITAHDGSQKRKTVYGKTKADVADKIRELTASSCPDTAVETVAGWLTEWLDVYARPALKQTTWESYETQARVHLIPAFGAMKLKDLTTPTLQRFFNEKASSGLSVRSVRYIHQVLNQAFKKAKKLHMVGKNPCDDVDLPAGEKPRIRPLTPEELTVFLGAARGSRHFVALLLEWATGLRRGELLGLEWQDVDLKRGAIHVRQSLVRTRDRGLMISTPKTRSSLRTIHIPAEVVAELRAHKKRQAIERLAFGLTWQGDLVFSGEGGRPLDPRAFTRAFERIIEKAELPRVSFHDMRHSHATMLLALGESSKVAQERLGHARVSTTMDVYQHVIPEMQKRAVDKLEALLRPEGLR